MSVCRIYEHCCCCCCCCQMKPSCTFVSRTIVSMLHVNRGSLPHPPSSANYLRHELRPRPLPTTLTSCGHPLSPFFIHRGAKIDRRGTGGVGAANDGDRFPQREQLCGSRMGVTMGGRRGGGGRGHVHLRAICVRASLCGPFEGMRLSGKNSQPKSCLPQHYLWLNPERSANKVILV